VEEGFVELVLPGRLEVVRRGPTVLVDAAHNPAGARALAASVTEAFAFTHLVAVVSVLTDKDVLGILAALEPAVDEVVVTQNMSPRAMGVDDLAALAVEVFGADRVEVAASFAGAVDSAITLAEEADTYAASGVVITGSVVTAGQARALLRRGERA
jgi:Folylpolyglutamate synthase